MKQGIEDSRWLKVAFTLVIAINFGIALNVLVLVKTPLTLERMQSTTLRELAYQREREKGDGRAVYVVLYEYYGAERLVITEEAMAYVGPGSFNITRYGRFSTVQVVEDGMQQDEINLEGEEWVEAPFGLEMEKLATLLVPPGGEAVDVIYGELEEDGVVFGPASATR